MLCSFLPTYAELRITRVYHHNTFSNVVYTLRSFGTVDGRICIITVLFMMVYKLSALKEQRIIARALVFSVSLYPLMCGWVA